MFFPRILPGPLRFLLLWSLPILLLSSCASYKANLMFQPLNEEGEIDESQLAQQMSLATKQYVIQPGDYLSVRVFTNNGESILDPNGEVRFGGPGGLGGVNPGTGPSAGSAGSSGAGGGSAAASAAGGSADNLPSFLVQADGRVRLPMVELVAVAGRSLLQADSLLEGLYSKYYKEVFVVTRVTNRRVFVLGAPGGKVITLNNENTTVLEVLAQAGGISSLGGGGEMGNAHRIRLIRGADPKTAQVHQIDLSTINGMRKASMQVTANDVVYIEPVRRPGAEALRDYGRVFAFFTGIITAMGILLRFVI